MNGFNCTVVKMKETRYLYFLSAKFQRERCKRYCSTGTCVYLSNLNTNFDIWTIYVSKIVSTTRVTSTDVMLSDWGFCPQFKEFSIFREFFWRQEILG